VPVKAMYRALKMAFKRHRLEGGILNVWEHYTTQKCHRCEQIMTTRDVPWTQEDIEKEDKKGRRRYDQGVSAAEREESPDIAAKVRELEKLLHPDPPLCSRQKRDRDFRVCEHCSTDDQTKKTRNRDFNAAINILKLTMCELRGEERPKYLCPAAKKTQGFEFKGTMYLVSSKNTPFRRWCSV